MDCYIFMDPTIPEEKACMSFLCVDCKREFFPDTEMHLHPGSKEGYGPFDFICDKCGCFLHEEKENNNEEEEIETPN